MYKGGSFDFTFKIKENYPHEPPKVKCTNKIYHPNIDLEGGVCLNILRDEWMPVLSIQSVVYGLQYLFLVRAPCAEIRRSPHRTLTPAPNLAHAQTRTLTHAPTRTHALIFRTHARTLTRILHAGAERGRSAEQGGRGGAASQPP